MKFPICDKTIFAMFKTDLQYEPNICVSMFI